MPSTSGVELGRDRCRPAPRPSAGPRRPRPCGSLRPSTSTPLIRVCAVNGTSSRAVQLAARGGRSAPWRARRSSGPRASRRRGSRAARRRRAPARSTPGQRRGTSAAWRLPSVIVPVLSSSSVEQSPAASTARPLIASTLRCTSRSMPGDADRGEQRADRRRDQAHEQRDEDDHRLLGARSRSRTAAASTTASRKMIVSPASRMLSAISFGVFWRLAPSTSAIIRSRKVSPGFERDAHDDLVGEHPRAAGDGGAVAAGLADHRRRLAGDRRLVDARDALDDVAVGRDHLAGRDDDVVADGERRARHLLDRAVGQPPARDRLGARLAQRRRPAPCRGPRPSPRRSSRTAR